MDVITAVQQRRAAKTFDPHHQRCLPKPKERFWSTLL